MERYRQISRKQRLGDHQPITDFWQVARGTQQRLAHLGIRTMRDIATARPEYIYKLFGVNAELLNDHAWGRESCLVEDIKNYRSKSHSVSFSQILPRDYTFDEARTIMSEMVLNGCHELMKRKVISKKIGIFIGCSRDRLPPSQGFTKLISATSLNSQMQEPVLALFDRIADEETPIRRLGISFSDVCDEGCEGYDFFKDWNSLEREKAREHAVLELSAATGRTPSSGGRTSCPVPPSENATR